MKKLYALSLAFFVLLPIQLNSQARPLDTTTFVVVGGSLAAGFADFQLVASTQARAFPTILARQAGTIMPLPLFREPTAGVFVSFNPSPQVLPTTNQSVLRALPFPVFVFNLSIPFATVSDALHLRPISPFVSEGDFKQTMVNLILGYPHLILDLPPLWTQVEYAEFMSPTFVVVELGFGDLIGAALADDASQITPASSFSNDYSALVGRLRGTHSSLLLLNVPDPTDTAYFTELADVAAIHGSDVATLMSLYGLNEDDWITLGGLVEIGNFFRQRQAPTLSHGSVLRAETVSALRQAVQSYNETISAVASSNNAVVFNLNGLYRQVKSSGIQVGSFHLGGGYLRGFFSTDGLFPTASGQAVLANELLQLVNSTFGTAFQLVDVESIASRDELVGLADISSDVELDPSEFIETRLRKGFNR